MIHTIKNYKWVIATFLICIVFGLLTFFTFINQGFIKLNDFYLQIILVADLILLILFFTLIIYKTYKILSERRKGKLGSETSLRYILFFSTTTLLPSIIIARSEEHTSELQSQAYLVCRLLLEKKKKT